jgi:hypothetical protein
MYKKAHAAIRADPEAKSKPAKEVTKKRSVYHQSITTRVVFP